jgi:glutathione-regulated potassium-efflux system ancillary protein KefC
MADPGFLRDALVYLGAAVVCVPLAKRIGFDSVLGYLLAGCLIGPSVLGLVSDVDSILRFSEFGVVLMLFLIGLDLETKRLVEMRRAVFVGGGLQMALCGAALAVALMFTGLTWQAALIAGLALAMSSTAIAVQTMTDRNLLAAPIGRSALGILLFQDIAAIVLIAAVPLLGAHDAADGPKWRDAALAIAAIGGVIVIGRYVTRPVMRLIAAARVREIFTAFALLLVFGIAELMQLADLSMALGAFVAGVLLASSEFRHALVSDIAPFKGLLLGLFFIAVGMSIDFSLVAQQPLALAALLLAMLMIKGLLLVLIAPWLDVPRAERWRFAALLAQAGEFAFVLFAVARSARVLPEAWDALLNAAVALSMALTPLLLLGCDRRDVRGARGSHNEREPDRIDDDSAPVIIAGFGRYGQIVGRLLFSQGITATVLDHDPDQIDTLRRFGYKVFYGDATRLDLLRAAGAEKARLLVVAIDDVEESLALVDRVRAEFPGLRIFARARNVRHLFELVERGVEKIERETFESALRSGRQVLEALGADPYEARQVADRFRRANLATLMAMQPHFRDEGKLVAIAKSGREELEENLRRDREARGQGDSADWR